MPEVVINTIPIDFPYIPYECQIKYMEKVIECLTTRQNGLLESPTGTGKTLCLLCATLGWLQHNRRRSVGLDNEYLSKFGNDYSPHPHLLDKNLVNIPEHNNNISRIIYSSRTHTQLVQVLKELKKTKYANNIHSALLASREQYCIHPQVSKEENNLLKIQKCRGKVHHRTCHFYNNMANVFTSARGSSSSSTLAAQRKSEYAGRNGTTSRSADLPSVPDIEDLLEFGRANRVCPYYSSRELAKTADLVLMPYNYLVDKNSRRGRTITTNNSTGLSNPEEGGGDSLIRGAVLIFDEAHNLEKFCEEAASLEITTGDVAAALVELDDIIDRYTNAQRQGCNATLAYYTASVIEPPGQSDPPNMMPDFSLEELARVKEIFMDLEEALDSIDLGPIPNRASSDTGSASTSSGRVLSVDYLFDTLTVKLKLDASSARSCVTLLDRITTHVAVSGESRREALSSFNVAASTTTASFAKGRNTKAFDSLASLLKTVFGIGDGESGGGVLTRGSLENQSSSDPHGAAAEALKKSSKASSTHPNGLRAALQAKYDLFSFSGADYASGSGVRSSTARTLKRDIHENMKNFKLHIRYDVQKFWKAKVAGWSVPLIKSTHPRILSLWCFSPSHTIKELFRSNIRCLILTSGTLSPISSFSQAMNVDFKVQLENEHIINPDQLLVAALPKGPDGTILNSSYNNRKSEKYMMSLGVTVLNFARIIPSGVLLFFPSYTQMQNVTDFWRSRNIWSSIQKFKPIFMEPRNKDKLTEEVRDYYDTVDGSKSADGDHVTTTTVAAILFGVCRGKISEGFDFADQYGRAVILAGIPYPSRHEPRIALKIQFMNERSGVALANKSSSVPILDGNAWYQLETSRAVNQAIGRVIRHKHDFGAILLCDERFGQKARQDDLSRWVRPFVRRYYDGVIPVNQRGSDVNDVPVGRGFGALVGALKNFFQKAAQNYPIGMGRILMPDSSGEEAASVESRRKRKKRVGCQSGQGGSIGAEWLSQYRACDKASSTNTPDTVIDTVPETQALTNAKADSLVDLGGEGVHVFSQLRRTYKFLEPSTDTPELKIEGGINSVASSQSSPSSSQYYSIPSSRNRSPPARSKNLVDCPRTPPIKNGSNGAVVSFLDVIKRATREEAGEKIDMRRGDTIYPKTGSYGHSILSTCPKLKGGATGLLEPRDDILVRENLDFGAGVGDWFEVCHECKHFARVAHSAREEGTAPASQNIFRIEVGNLDGPDTRTDDDHVGKMFSDLEQFLISCREGLGPHRYQDFLGIVKQYGFDGAVEPFVFNLREIFSPSPPFGPHILFIKKFFLKTKLDVEIFERDVLTVYDRALALGNKDVGENIDTSNLTEFSVKGGQEEDGIEIIFPPKSNLSPTPPKDIYQVSGPPGNKNSSLPKCALCEEVPPLPIEHVICSHVCCKACWDRVLYAQSPRNVAKCPTCHVAVMKRNLVPVYFGGIRFFPRDYRPSDPLGTAHSITSCQINNPDSAPDLKKRAKLVQKWKKKNKKFTSTRQQTSITEHFGKK